MASEKRLIDANALREVYCDGCSAKAQGCSPFDDPVCGTVQLINEAPTVDAVEVVHGRWENISGGMVKLGDCSECKVRQPVLGTNYCKNCGAKMDGDGNV